MRSAFAISAALVVVASGAAHAFDPNPTLSALPPNTAKDLGRYTCPQQADDQPCTLITDYSRLNYDPVRHQLLMFGGGHATTFRDDVDVFNFSTLKWSPAYPQTPCSAMSLSNFDTASGTWSSSGNPASRHTYDMLVMVEGELVMMNSVIGRGGCAPTSASGGDPFFVWGKIQHYNPSTKRWTASAVSPDLWYYAAAAEFDPVSRKVIVLGPNSNAGAPAMWYYDPFSSPRKAGVISSNVPGEVTYSNNLVYFPPNQKMYFLRGDGAVFEVSLNRSSGGISGGSVVRVSTSGTAPSTGETGFAYDSANKLIGGAVTNGTFYAYDPLTKQWTSRAMQTTGGSVGSVAYHALDYDPVNNVYVFITDTESGGRTWAYRFGGTAPPPDKNPPARVTGVQAQ